MATLRPPNRSLSTSSPPFNRRRKSWARRVERCCCTTLSYFPLVFVYGLATWAIFVEVNVAFLDASDWSACTKAVLGVVLYGLANSSYTIAVFTNPGSPLDPREDLSISKSGANGRQSGARPKGGYDVLPTYERDDPTATLNPSSALGRPDMTTVTAKSSTGRSRYCKKCQTLKPDRTHHCSTCGRCVLKMDHHCPWLATCVGLRNYKAFLLFLAYISLYSWVCFAVTAGWMYAAITDGERMREGWMLVNAVMLSVLSGIIGLVISGFTAWHIYLVVRGETTIESLEKTRYLTPLRKSMEPAHPSTLSERHPLHDGEEGHDGQDQQELSLLEQLKETHANALPGILRPEEGESSRSGTASPMPPDGAHNRQTGGSPAKDSLQRSYASMEAQREHERYAAYLDEQESEKLPNAFDMGWKRNLQHVFGNRPLLWFLPVCNTSGDGWLWEVSPKWTEARASQAREREARGREEAALREMDANSLHAFNGGAGGGAGGSGRFEGPTRRDYRWTPGQGFVDSRPAAPLAPQHYHPPPPSNGHRSEGSIHMQMQPLDRRKGPGGPAGAGDDDSGVDRYDTSSDEDLHRPRRHQQQQPRVNGAGPSTANWNDLPDDFLPSRQRYRSPSHGRRKGD